MGGTFHEFTVLMIFQPVGNAVYAKTETVNPVGYCSRGKTDNCSEKQVSGVVNSHVYPGVTRHDGPQHEERGERPILEQQHDETSQCKRVGRMAGGETVHPASFPVDDMNQIGNSRVPRRAGTFEYGAQDGTARLISDHDQ